MKKVFIVLFLSICHSVANAQNVLGRAIVNDPANIITNNDYAPALTSSATLSMTASTVVEYGIS